MRYALLILLAASSAAWAQNRPQLTWKGLVSGGAELHIQSDRVDMQGRETGSVDQPTINMFDPLPAKPQSIRLKVRRGRGRVHIVEQPAAENEFTATIRIEPPGANHEQYVIDFFWEPARGK